MTLERILKTIF